MSKTVKRVLWFVTVFVLVIFLGLAISENHELKRENRNLEYSNEQLQDINIQLTDRNWSLQFQLQNEKDSSQ